MVIFSEMADVRPRRDDLLDMGMWGLHDIDALLEVAYVKPVEDRGLKRVL